MIVYLLVLVLILVLVPALYVPALVLGVLVLGTRVENKLLNERGRFWRAAWVIFQNGPFSIHV